MDSEPIYRINCLSSNDLNSSTFEYMIGVSNEQECSNRYHNRMYYWV